MWNNREKLDAGQSLKSYLYKIANNLVIDHFRKKGVEQSYFAADPPDDASVTTDEVDFELREQIEQAVAGLPPPVRQVFQMSRFDGLKYHEIAKALEISVKTVEARMSKALASLREQLEPFL